MTPTQNTGTIAIKARARAKFLSRHVDDVEMLCRSFVDLKKRVSDLLPQREDMKKQIESKLDESLFGDVIRDDSTSSYAMSLKSMTRFLFQHLSKLCSSSHRGNIEKHTSELLGMIGNEDTKEGDDEDEDDRYGNQFARKLLMYVFDHSSMVYSIKITLALTKQTNTGTLMLMSIAYVSKFIHS